MLAERVRVAMVMLTAVLCSCLAWRFGLHGNWVASAIAFLGPVLFWLAFERPVLFPYALFALLVPFDNLLGIGRSGTVTRLLGLASGVCFLLTIVRTRRVIAPGPTVFWIATMLLYGAITLVWTIAPTTGTLDWRTLFELAALYAIASLVPLQGRDLRVILTAIVIGGVIAGIYGIYTFHGEHAALLSADPIGRLRFAFGKRHLDVNLFADSLILPIALSMWAWLNARRGVFKFALSIGLIIMLYAISLTASRESFLAIGATVAVFGWRSRWRARVFPVLFGLVLFGFLSPTVRQRFSEAISTGGAGRSAIWHVGLKAFERHPVFGWGFGSFAEAYNRAYLQVFQHYDAGWTRASHNLFVHYGVEGGICAIILVLAVWTSQWAQARDLRAIPQLADLSNALCAALIGLFIAAMFIDLFATKTLWLAFALIAQVRSTAIGMYETQRRTPTLARPAARWPAVAAVVLLAATFLPSAVRADSTPRHVLTYLYYTAADTNTAIPASFMARYATFIETAGGHPGRVRAFRAAGGRYALSYADPTFVPYCEPPFVPPAGRCAGPIGDDPALSESAWLHAVDGARLHRSDAYTGEYQDILNPLSPEVSRAVHRYTQTLSMAGVNAVFFDETGSELDGDFPSFGGQAVEIPTKNAWFSGERAIIASSSLPVILNGSGEDWGPAYDGAILKLPNVLGVNFEGCFSNRDIGLMNVRHGYWMRMERALLADERMRKYVVCMMSGPFDPAQRIYALASWWLTYDPRWSVAAPVTRAPDGFAVYPEYDIVPTDPDWSAYATLARLKQGGVYVRTFARCYDRGVPIGACAAVVNPDLRPHSIPSSLGTFGRRLSLGDRSVYTGGTVAWQRRSSNTIGPTTAEILRR
ncbi:MAG: O-antigen ligase family protein [Vulcanimicrobiaceae bacterium]